LTIVIVFALLSQQSHHCGIETVRVGEIVAQKISSNRTIVGLKPAGMARCVEELPAGSNRTIVGLKLLVTRDRRNFFPTDASK